MLGMFHYGNTLSVVLDRDVAIVVKGYFDLRGQFYGGIFAVGCTSSRHIVGCILENFIDNFVKAHGDHDFFQYNAGCVGKEI